MREAGGYWKQRPGVGHGNVGRLGRILATTSSYIGGGDPEMTKSSIYLPRYWRILIIGLIGGGMQEWLRDIAEARFGDTFTYVYVHKVGR